ncbi:MAG: RNB domain-containing ribonuclease [Candidatus Sericytochromatia bacterium]
MVGICQQVNSSQLRLLTQQNKEMNLVEKKVLHTLERRLSPSANRLEKVDALREWSQQAETAAKSVELQTLWEVLEGETEALGVNDLADMCYSSAGDADRSALLRALAADRIYFDRKGDEGFVARSHDKVQQILEQQNREQQRQQARASTVAWLRTCLVQRQAMAVPPESQHFVAILQDVAIRQQKSNHYPAVSQILQEAGTTGKTEELCLQALIQGGVWDEDINLALLEYDVPQHFSPELLNQAAALAPDVESHLARRSDLRHLPTITIDDAETTDIDDALSWEMLPDGQTRLWIHIADPAELIVPDSPLDQEAARRFTSIYLCEGKIEMLPAVLAQDLCSLVAGTPRLALSVAVTLGREGQIGASEICESVIHVKRRMSYDEVDAELESLPEIQHLLTLALALRQQRLERGAVEFSRPELRIKVDADKQITIKRVERDSPAQQLVSEMMILANHLVARTLHSARVPLIYKVQEPPTETFPDGRPLLKRAEMSVRLSEHYGLGLDAYTQFTSPIRRYNDLVLHRQIKSWLRKGHGMYSDEQLQHMIALSDQAVFSANFIQRENIRYWLLKYFAALPTPRLTPARLNNIKDDKGWVHLIDYCYDVPMAAGDLAGLKEGDPLWISIEQAQPRRSRLVIRRVADPAPSAAPEDVSAP